jgi:hypothetical protein
MKKVVWDFYSLFYNNEPSEEEIDLILAGSQNLGPAASQRGSRGEAKGKGRR